MLHKTRGIVINYIKYRETSIIAKIYTEEFGIQTYIENGVRSAKSKNKIALFQPLTLLDLVVYHRDTGDIFRISEIKCHTALQTLPYHFIKSGIAIFMTEVLNKTLKEEAPNHDLFQFLLNSILYLDLQEKGYENFPIQFLIKLSRYMGFAPQKSDEILEQVGAFRIYAATDEEKQALDSLIANRYDEIVSVPNVVRRQILEYVLRFYSLHVENFGEVRSLQVLKEIMS
jgi:DNA repair protein RecO (recombination protein O)